MYEHHVQSLFFCALQAKYALPRGGGPAPRTTRIFVARIPPMVSDVEFRQYFERFGQVQVELSCHTRHVRHWKQLSVQACLSIRHVNRAATQVVVMFCYFGSAGYLLGCCFGMFLLCESDWRVSAGCPLAGSCCWVFDGLEHPQQAQA